MQWATCLTSGFLIHQSVSTCDILDRLVVWSEAWISSPRTSTSTRATSLTTSSSLPPPTLARYRTTTRQAHTTIESLHTEVASLHRRPSPPPKHASNLYERGFSHTSWLCLARSDISSYSSSPAKSRAWVSTRFELANLRQSLQSLPGPPPPIVPPSSTTVPSSSVHSSQGFSTA